MLEHSNIVRDLEDLPSQYNCLIFSQISLHSDTSGRLIFGTLN